MRLKEFFRWILALLFLAVCMLGLIAWASTAVEAKPRLQGAGSSVAYLPLVLREATPTEIPPTPIPPQTCPSHHAEYELQLYDLINQARADHGVAALKPNTALETSAGWHSDDMAVNHFISHIGSDGSTVWEREVEAGYTGHWGAEVIMYTDTPQAAMDWWMSEGPGGAHYDTILGDLDDFGVGYAKCNDEWGGYFTVDFGHR